MRFIKTLAIVPATAIAVFWLAACGGSSIPATTVPAATTPVTSAPAATATANSAVPGVALPVLSAPAPAVASVPAQQPAATDPWTAISTYYSLIESGQYQAAWDMGSQAFMDQNGDNYSAFVADFANTGTQDLTEISESAGEVWVNLSAANIATGGTQYFTGAFTTDNGVITSGSMTQTS